MGYALIHSVEKFHLDNHRGCHLDNLEWHHVTAVSAHPLGLSHQWEMNSNLLACWSPESCLGGTCVRSVFHIFFSYLRELKLSLTILVVKVGQNTFCEARRASHCHSPQTTYSSKSTCCTISAQKSDVHVVFYAGRLTSQRSIAEIINW